MKLREAIFQTNVFSMAGLIVPFLGMAGGKCFAQCSYSVQIAYGPDCGILGHMPANPWGLNELGTVVGNTSTCGEVGYAFRWSGGPSVTLFSVGRATDAGAIGINSAGQIIGIKEGPTGHVGFFYENGVTVDVGMLPGANFAEANAINELGQVCGYAQNVSSGPLQAFVWTNGDLSALQLPFGPNGVAYDINNNGQIVGWMGEVPALSFYAEAFLWDNGAAISLGVPRGATSSDARAVNNLGQVCGLYISPNPNGSGFVRHAFFWSKGVMSDLGILPGFVQSAALDINDQGAVVGYCLAAQGAPPPPTDALFLWHNGVMTGLSSLIPPNTGLHLIPPIAINNSGQITCRAHTDDNDYVMALLTPVPSMPGDFNCDGHVNVDDLLGVINHWGFTGGNPADFNHDGSVNAADLMIVIQNWGP